MTILSPLLEYWGWSGSIYHPFGRSTRSERERVYPCRDLDRGHWFLICDGAETFFSSRCTPLIFFLGIVCRICKSHANRKHQRLWLSLVIRMNARRYNLSNLGWPASVSHAFHEYPAASCCLDLLGFFSIVSSFYLPPTHPSCSSTPFSSMSSPRTDLYIHIKLWILLPAYPASPWLPHRNWS